MTTHLPPPYASRNMTAMDHEVAHLAATEQALQDIQNANSGASTEAQAVNGFAQNANGHAELQASTHTGKVPQAGQEKSHSAIVDLPNSSSLTEQLPASLAALDESSSRSAAHSDNVITPSAQALNQDPTAIPEPAQAPTSEQQATLPNVPSQPTGVQEEETEEAAATGSVNYQALLDQINPPSASLPGNDAATGNPSSITDATTPSSATLPAAGLPPGSAGLPPRPPPQVKPTIHPNYASTEDIRSYHYPHVTPSSAQSSQPAQSPTVSNSLQTSSPQAPVQLVPPALAGIGANGMSPPPLASFQQTQDDIDRIVQQPQRLSDANATSPTASKHAPGSREDNAPWPVDIQRKYEQFLRDEELYTAEGAWEKFPQGSRLFVGMFAALNNCGTGDRVIANSIQQATSQLKS